MTTGLACGALLTRAGEDSRWQTTGLASRAFVEWRAGLVEWRPRLADRYGAPTTLIRRRQTLLDPQKLPILPILLKGREGVGRWVERTGAVSALRDGVASRESRRR